MERTTWMTEQPSAASATGAPALRLVAAGAGRTSLQNQKRAGFVPPVSGPGLVRGSATVASHLIDHTAMGRTAWDGTPLGSPGAGFG